MQFILTGFTQVLEFRVFAFEFTGDDKVRTAVTVRADLGLARFHGIRLQELPLLCRNLLERRELNLEQAGERSALTFNAKEMEACARERAAAHEAAKKKRTPQKPAAETVGAA